MSPFLAQVMTLFDVRTDGLGADIEGLDAVVGEKGGDNFSLPWYERRRAELHTPSSLLCLMV